MSPPVDVVIAGGGPAGAIAALVLARAGVRVVVFDRARFPRHKLCGDTINPGALAALQRLGVAHAAGAFAVDGMLVTGEFGVRVAGGYPHGITGRAVLREAFDHALLTAAAAAGARVEEEVLVRGAAASGGIIDGVYVARRNGLSARVGCRVVVAADGRYSRVGRSAALVRYPRTPRRWAVGAYFTDVAGTTTRGEMHIRRRKYVGVAPLPGGLTNACVVTADHRIRDPRALLLGTLNREPALKPRFAGARLVSRPVLLGPLAVEAVGAGAPGLLLAGDAAGFIDPITGDGLRFAIRGSELAALEALQALEHGFGDAHVRLQDKRARDFRAKWTFNRALRRVVGSPAGVRLASAAAALASSYVEQAVRYAGDVHAERLCEAVGDAPPQLEEGRGA